MGKLRRKPPSKWTSINIPSVCTNFRSLLCQTEFSSALLFFSLLQHSLFLPSLPPFPVFPFPPKLRVFKLLAFPRSPTFIHHLGGRGRMGTGEKALFRFSRAKGEQQQHFPPLPTLFPFLLPRAMAQGSGGDCFPWKRIQQGYKKASLFRLATVKNLKLVSFCLKAHSKR